MSFTGVTGAADDRTFVLSAQGPEPSVVPPFPAQRFFLLPIDPAARAGARMTLTALPAGDVPAGNGIREMALSPDGTHLAAGQGPAWGTPKSSRVRPGHRDRTGLEYPLLRRVHA